MKTNIILEAIDNYDIYSKNQRKILKTLVAVSLDNLACISVNAISEATNIASNSIYVALRKLENNKCIDRERGSGQKTNIYRINPEKIKEIVTIYDKKKKGLNQIKE